MLLEHFADGHRGLVIVLATGSYLVHVAIFPDAQRWEYHSYAEGAGGEASDGGHSIVAEQAHVVGLKQGKMLVESDSLLRPIWWPVAIYQTLCFAQEYQLAEEQ